MKKAYISPLIKGHKIVLPSLLGSSDEQPIFDSNDSSRDNGQAKFKGSRSLFEEDAPEKNDFAYGL